MKVTKKVRVFIKNLPEPATATEIETKFANYGKVIDLKIQERKNFNPTFCNSPYFAYVNVETDDHSLQKCFSDFAHNLWHKQSVEIQIAKDSFLDVLKREQAESKKDSSNNDHKDNKEVLNVSKIDTKTDGSDVINHKSPKHTPNVAKTDLKIDSSDVINQRSSKKTPKVTKIDLKIDSSEFLNQKSSKKTPNASKIDSQTETSNFSNQKGPKRFKTDDLPPSEIKRIQSVNQMVREYHQQKNLVKTALSNVDFRVNKKIVFDDQNDEYTENNSINSKEKNDKNRLFESDEESEVDFNFEMKTAFEGKKGKELYELQSRYKNDKRFVLDERFINDEDGDENETVENSENITIEEEKKREFEILEEVLGTKVKPKEAKQERIHKKGMLRYDPSHSDHLKYEIKEAKTNKKSEETEIAPITEENEQTKVSKEIFYKVSDDLKETLQKEQGFSLLNLYGNSTEIENHKDSIEEPTIIKKNINFVTEPFKYDSSENEEETEEIQKVEAVENDKKPQSNSTKFWSESFFFADDDFRLQEGFDFMQRMASDETTEFIETRKKLKEIVKTKVRHNLRKNKPFKKKLGGNKRKKMIRIKKAMKR